MPGQEEHDKPENLVESSTELEKRAARSLEEAADSHATLEGYFAVNDVKDSEQLEKEAAQDRAKADNRDKGHPVR